MNIGETIKQLRKERHISADALAEKIGVSRSTMFRYEKGDIEKVPIEIVAKIAEALDVEPAVLMGLKADTVDQISKVSRVLLPDRQHKVLNYAQHQLDEQNSPATSPVHDYEDPELLAAHLENRNLNDEQQERVDDYIAKLLQEEKKE
ncbi:helix-turn-helix domain-containing protein [Lacticaseibacillus hulanensis]|uniref:helix-turn-helix domain-containing protein n=1 Tax=Lacticaseibacillus hulanensis TaxID=2493111 RepID=UPI000FD7C735|nr:helix-turn-helix transcriptional regulator [Lacticaseibacillus hulanensis]